MKRLLTTMTAVCAVIAEMSAIDAGTIGTCTLDPEPGTVTSLTTIKVDFPSTGFMGIDPPVTDKIKAITLTSASAGYYAVKADYTGASFVTLHFAATGTTDEVSALPDGVYTLTIPEKTFSEYFSTTKFNSTVTAEYTVAGGGEVTPPAPASPFDGYEAVPAPAASYGKLCDFSITFPDLGGGLDWPLADLSKITLRREGDETVYIANSPTVSGPDYRTVTFGFNTADQTMSEKLTFTEAGVYTLSIAEGAFSEYGHSDVKSPAMTLTYTVDPALNFTYVIAPSPEAYYENLTVFTLTPGESVGDIAIADASLRPTLSLDATSIGLEATEADGAVVLAVTAVDRLNAGDWKLTIPAGFLKGTSKSSQTAITNSDPIELIYKVRKPMTFGYTVSPADGSTVDILGRITLDFTGSGLKQVAIDTKAGTPAVTGASLTEAAPVSATLSGKSVDLVCQTDLADGTYTVSVPDGFITTTDTNGLMWRVPAFTLTYTVKAPAAPDFSGAGSIAIINEGWFGHDSGSINFLPAEGPVYYDAFALQNPGRSLGVTSQSGQVFGDRFYVVSKIAPYVTALDAATFKYIDHLTKIAPEGESDPQPHAFCAVSPVKGYLSTQKGLFVVDMTDGMKVTKEITAPWLTQGAFGQLLPYGDRVFAISKLDGIVAIDTATDEPTQIDVITAAALTVSADGSIYSATTNEDNELVRIDPATLEVTPIDIDAPKAKIQNPWSTWRESSFAADRDKETVYFALAGYTPRQIARYDIATGTYDPEFITLPGKSDGLEADMILYGQGISVDPSTGYIVATATEAGYGSHYEHNAVYFYDPATGALIDDKTVMLRDYYWFPAMTLYPGFSAPTLAPVEEQLLSTKDAEPVTIDLAEEMNLAVGNRHLVTYSASSSDESVFTASVSPAGVITLTPVATGAATLTFGATYQGRATTLTAEVSVNPSSLDTIGSDTVTTPNDVYTLTGVLLMRDASETDIANLPAGLYIIGGKKRAVMR